VVYTQPIGVVAIEHIMFWQLALYMTIVFASMFVVLKIAAVSKSVGIPPALTSCITLAGFVYVSCLIPGVLGLLYTDIVYGIFFALCVAVVLLPLENNQSLSTRGTGECDKNTKFTVLDVCLVGIGLLGAIPLLTYLRSGFLSSLRHPDTALGWDTVSYHLPAFIEFLQHHTLWSLDGPYQSYSFAFELIGNFLSYPFYAHWGLVLANFLAITILILAIIVVARALVPSLSERGSVNWVPCSVLVVGIWSSLFPDSIGNIGKNDIFMTACLVAALSFLLEIATTTKTGAYPVRLWGLVCLVSISVGLAFATKPSSLAFVLFFIIATWIVIRIRDLEYHTRAHRSIIAAAIVLSISVLLGGFWLARNLLSFGYITSDAGAWKLSLIANLGNPALYKIYVQSIELIIAVLAVIPGSFQLYLCRRKGRDPLPLALVLMFHVVACASFAATPFAFDDDGLGGWSWQIRLGMPLFVSASILYSSMAVYLCNAVVFRLTKAQKVAFSTFSMAVLMLALPLSWHATESTGLPGYDQIKGLPRTNIYTWVQKQQNPLRIYSAGLRPYGLYGASWANTLFYDLHSTELSPLEAGKARIAAIIVNFRPDLILISVDPHGYTGMAVKPDIVAWMRAESDYFEEVYNDETVSGFKLRNGVADRLKTEVPAGYELKMGG